MLNLKMSIGTQNPVLVLKVLKVQRKISIDTQNPVPVLKGIKSAEEDEYQYWMCEYRYSKLLKA